MKGKRRKGAGAPGIPGRMDDPIPGGPGGADPAGEASAAGGSEVRGRSEASPAPAPAPPARPLPSPPREAAPPAPPKPAAETPPAPASSAREMLSALRGRLQEMLPGWASRPEDPVNVLLEVVAERADELREEILAAGDRAAADLLLRLGIRPRPPRPARGVVVFEPSAVGPSAAFTDVPPGTPIAARREQGTGAAPPRIAFETAKGARVGAARLARALSVDGNEVEELPVDVSPGGSRSPAALFAERLRAGRELYLGDRDFAALCGGGKAIQIDWPGAPSSLAGVPWEYRALGGWRRLPARFERAGEPPGVRMHLRGPLPDLTSELRERADLPWIRCALGAEALDLAAPVIASIEEGAGAAPKGRAVARIFLAGPDEVLDLAFEPRLIAPPASPDLHPAVYLGWDAASSSTVFMAIEEPGAGKGPPGEVLLEPPAPGLAWEYSRGEGWEAIPAGGVEDGTRGFTRSGLFTAVPAADWDRRRLFGDDLFWVRARWVDGERASSAAAALFSRAAEVVQGRTVEELPVGWVSRIEGGVLAIPALNEGEVEGFDRIELRPADSREVWERAIDLGLAGPGDRLFVLEHGARGELLLRFGDGVHGRLPPRATAGKDIPIIAREVRVGIGAAGNIPARTPLVLACDIPGIASVWSPLPAAGGEDREPLEALRRRACAEWRTGGRVVTAGDFDLWVRALFPGSAGALSGPDPLRPGGVLVVPIPIRPLRAGRFAPAFLLALEKELGERAPLGIPVRVAEPAVLAVTARVDAAPPPEEREGLREAILQDLSRRLAPPLPGGGRGDLSGKGLNADLPREIMAGGSPVVVRLLDRDGRPLTSRRDGPLDQVMEVVEVLFSGETGPPPSDGGR